ERLRKKDEAAGIENKPLTDAQKAAIAEIRNFYEAKLAEAEILHHSKRIATFDPAALATLEEEYRRDRERLTSERDSKIEKARRSAKRRTPRLPAIGHRLPEKQPLLTSKNFFRTAESRQRIASQASLRERDQYQYIGSPAATSSTPMIDSVGCSII